VVSRSLSEIASDQLRSLPTGLVERIKGYPVNGLKSIFEIEKLSAVESWWHFAPEVAQEVFDPGNSGLRERLLSVYAEADHTYFADASREDRAVFFATIPWPRALSEAFADPDPRGPTLQGYAHRVISEVDVEFFEAAGDPDEGEVVSYLRQVHAELKSDWSPKRIYGFLFRGRMW
jgi:hypothetical protein